MVGAALDSAALLQERLVVEPEPVDLDSESYTNGSDELGLSFVCRSFFGWSLSAFYWLDFLFVVFHMYEN